MLCPITGSYKNCPSATGEDVAQGEGGGAIFDFIHLILFYSFYFFTGRLKGSPGQEGVKDGDNDVCPPTEGHTNIHSFMCACT